MNHALTLDLLILKFGDFRDFAHMLLLWCLIDLLSVQRLNSGVSFNNK